MNRPAGWTELPVWLIDDAAAVIADLQGPNPLPGMVLLAKPVDGDGGVLLGLFEPDGNSGGAGGTIGPKLEGASKLMTLAEIVQDEWAETQSSWGQARPPCPYHPHPARPAARGDVAWWVCEARDEPLFRIGRGEVPA